MKNENNKDLEKITNDISVEKTLPEVEVSLQESIDTATRMFSAQPESGLFLSGLKSFPKTLWRWTKRTLFGASKDLNNAFSVEDIESPGKMIFKGFFEKKLAVISLIVLIGMFAFVLFGPLANPVDLGYAESLHKNMAPSQNLLSIPSKLKNNIDTISSFSTFSVGLSKDGEVFAWGNTKIPNSATKADLANIPDEIKNSKVRFVAAGADHAIAITDSGKVIGWGEYGNSQYGNKSNLAGTSQIIDMPEQLLTGTIDVNNVKQLACGYQVTAIVMKDGSCYYWGNYKSGAENLKMLGKGNVEHVEFLNSRCVARTKDGKLMLGSSKEQFDTIIALDQNGNEIRDENGKVVFLSLFDDYLADRKVTNIAATSGAIAIVTDDNKVLVVGSLVSSNSKVIAQPTFADGEVITDVIGGAKHFAAITSKGNIYCWGENTLGQCEVPKKHEGAIRLVGGSFQTYAVNAEDELVAKWGLKGYLMGTDELGRDIAVRVMNGGKMTMTIGAVAVIISSIIGIIIGCISGYFGGWVDLALMRVTEVFASIPFLPFALILSAILKGSSIPEDTRIFMIMVILGLLSWTGLARMIRGQVLAEREKEFVIAAKSMGIKETRIAFKHILPNVFSIILVSMTLDFAGCMLTESSLSYLGFGVQLPRPTWGNMLNGCNNEIVIGQFWWRWFFPSIFLLVTTVCINIIGDALRDAMDPKSNSYR